MGRFDDPAAKVPRDQLEELAFEQKINELKNMIVPPIYSLQQKLKQQNTVIYNTPAGKRAFDLFFSGMALLFLSPIFYNLDKFKKALPSFEYLNPISGIIINARRTTMEGTAPDYHLLLWDLGYATLLLLLGIFLLNKLGSKAAEKL